MSHLPDNVEVIIDASKAKVVHPDVIEIIEDFRLNALTRNITIELEGFVEQAIHDPVEKFGHIMLQNKDQEKKENVIASA